MQKPTPSGNPWTLLQVAALAIVAFLFACAFTGRWSAQEWQMPIEYGIDGPASDVKSIFTGVKAAEEGHLPLFLSKQEPSFGAPFVASWDDYPCTEVLHYMVGGFFARFIGVFAALNLLVILAHVLSVIGFYVACRLLKYRWEWSCAAALIFGFASYLFARSAHHVTLAYVAHIPLIIVAFRWAIDGGNGFDGAPATTAGNTPSAPAVKTGLLDNKHFYWALGIAVFTGTNNVYYTNMLVQFLGIAFLYQAFRKQWVAAGRALAVAACGLGVFLLMNVSTFWSQHVHGPNAIAVTRTYQYLEYSGFKLADMFIPPPTYWIPGLARWGTRYFSEVILKGEVPQGSYIGLAGIAAFLWVVGTSLRNIGQTTFKRPPWEALLIAWVITYATVGGFNGWVGSLGFVLFRSSTRYTIFILAAALLYAVRRLSAVSGKWGVQPRIAIALLITLIALGDQVPRVPNENPEGIAQAVNSDRAFAEEMESKVKPNTMVFQLPVMNFPESPAPGMPSSDHFRPFLYTKTLRYSFGDIKGRPQGAWQDQLALLPPETQIQKLESYGFGALYINGNGLADHGRSYLEVASARGLAHITSPAGDLTCIFLNASPTPEIPPQAPFFAKGWYEAEHDAGGNQQRMCRDNGELQLPNPTNETVTRYLQFILQGMDNRNVSISNGGTPAEVPLKANQGVRIQNMKIQLKPGTNVYTFSTDRTSLDTMRGPVSFVIANFQMTDAPVPAAN